MLCGKNVIKFVSDWLEGPWFSSGTSVSSAYKTDCHDITEILLKVVLYTINQTKSMVVYIFEMEARQTKYLPVLFVIYRGALYRQ
jgi:hypothetical protein